MNEPAGGHLDAEVKRRLNQKYSDNYHFVLLFEWIYDNLKQRTPAVSARSQKRYVAFYFSAQVRTIVAFVDLQSDWILIGVEEDVFDLLKPRSLSKAHFPAWKKSKKFVGVRVTQRSEDIIDLLEAAYAKTSLESAHGRRMQTDQVFKRSAINVATDVGARSSRQSPPAVSGEDPSVLAQDTGHPQESDEPDKGSISPEELILHILRRLPPERVSELLNYARFLEFQTANTTGHG